MVLGTLTSGIEPLSDRMDVSIMSAECDCNVTVGGWNRNKDGALDMEGGVRALDGGTNVVCRF